MASPPDYRLKIMDKTNDRKNINAGAAWVNDDGSITIQIPPGVVLDYNPDFVIRLWPNDYKTDRRDARDTPARARTERPAPVHNDGIDREDSAFPTDDDIPF